MDVAFRCQDCSNLLVVPALLYVQSNLVISPYTQIRISYCGEKVHYRRLFLCCHAANPLDAEL